MEIIKYCNLTVFVKLILLSLLFCTIFALGNTTQLELLINPKYILLIFLSELILLFFIFNLFPSLIRESQNHDKIKIFDTKYFLLLFIIIIILIFQLSPNFDSFFSKMTELKGLSITEIKSNNQNINPTSLENINEQPNTVEQKNIESNLETEKANKPEHIAYDNSNLKIDIVLDDNNFITLVESIHFSVDNYIDKIVKIKGFVFRTEDLDNNHFIISRMYMFCCAADATVIGFVCNKSNINYDFKANDWFEIEAIISKETLTIYSQKATLPVLKILNYRNIAKMDNPFVYPN